MQQDIALQFELFNGTKETVEPYDLGMGLIERDFKLVDIPRATAYDVQKQTGFDGRVSDNQYEKIAPGAAATITAVFTAPPVDATKLWFMTDVLMPVEVPIQPAGAAALEDDPVLTGPRDDEAYVNTLMCTNEGAEGESADTPVEIKLPSDVLFEFGKSELTPAAQAALDGVEDQIGSAEGTITIEGHTDAVGDDASNQLLSEARAASVQAALQERLGGESTFNAVGFGESRPVAPNTNPDGSDNPDGRAQNRRVEIHTGDMTAAGPPQLEAATDDRRPGGPGRDGPGGQRQTRRRTSPHHRDPDEPDVDADRGPSGQRSDQPDRPPHRHHRGRQNPDDAVECVHHRRRAAGGLQHSRGSTDRPTRGDR